MYIYFVFQALGNDNIFHSFVTYKRLIIGYISFLENQKNQYSYLHIFVQQ